MTEHAIVDEGVLDPRAAEWLAANPYAAEPLVDLPPEILELARGPVGMPSTRDIDHVTDDAVDGTPIRIYRNDMVPSGLVVYFHGGAHCVGSIGLMDNVARELTHASGATVVSVEYRLAPEHPFPAGLDDCEKVTRWAAANASDLGASADRVVVAGESAGGNLAAAVSLRLRGALEVPLAGQVLIYPGLDDKRSGVYPSRDEFDGMVLSHASMEASWDRYTGGRDLSRDPFAAPLQAESLADLPPAIVVLGGCDLLRDEGRAYAVRLRDADVPVEEVCIAGQPHGFINFGLPAAVEAFERIGAWFRKVLAT
jgi:acetyl esterase